MLILNTREAAATMAVIQNTGQQVAERAIIEAIKAIKENYSINQEKVQEIKNNLMEVFPYQN